MATHILNPNITPAISFDDIPGELPEGSVPEGTDYSHVADNAIKQLNNLSPEHFTNNAIWRDLLSLTHNLRTFNSRETVCSTLQALLQEKKVLRFERTSSSPRFSGFNWMDVDFTFAAQHKDIRASAAGILSCLQCPDGVWRIWMLRTWLEHFEGYGHPDKAELPAATDRPIQREPDEPLDAIIIGGGQAGLSTAGRLQALGVSYIVFEKNERVGDVWRHRYDSLKIHTPKEYGPLPLGWRFPTHDDNMLPAKRMGDGHEAWAEEYAVNVQTGTEVTAARYVEASHIWTATTSSVRGEENFKARNLVLALGPGLTQPISPTWATPSNIATSKFQGDIFHASAWKSAKPWSHANKRGIVIGVANTGHDIAEDMANAGMHTTMIQRGPTFVLPVEWLHAAFAPDYHTNKPTTVADQEQVTLPNKISREITNKTVRALVKVHAERFDALERAGFKVDRDGDLYSCLFERFGGHYIDHGGSARIAKGEIKVKSQPIKGLYAEGLELEDGSQIPADLIVLATGFSHDFRAQAAKIIGKEAAGRMDEFGGLDREGEMRGFARFSGRESIYLHRSGSRVAHTDGTHRSQSLLPRL